MPLPTYKLSVACKTMNLDVRKELSDGRGNSSSPPTHLAQSPASKAFCSPYSSFVLVFWLRPIPYRSKLLSCLIELPL